MLPHSGTICRAAVHLRQDFLLAADHRLARSAPAEPVRRSVAVAVRGA